MNFSKIKLQLIREKNYDYNSRSINSTEKMVKYINSILEIENEVQEIVVLVCLNAKNQIIAVSEIARGQNESCLFDMKNMFKTILLCNASKFILIHNHPTGISQPSKDDFEVSKRVKEASAIMNISFVDHIVIAGNGFCSCFL